MNAWQTCGRSLIVAVLLSTLAQGAIAAPSVADAKRNLEAARTALAKAVERIKVDPPSGPDLDAALTAVAALKTAIDAGAEVEPNDLDYAKAALAARKELRTQREYVEDRRSKVQMHQSRRDIDAALVKLNEAATKLESKQVGDKDFEAVRVVIAQIGKLLEQGQPFVAQDPAYAKYVGEVKATIARQEKAMGDRTTALAVEKLKAAIEPKRQGLTSAVSVLDAKTSSDAQFEAAETAAAALAKALEDGKALEAKDKGYKTFADQAREEIKQARKKSDGLWSATGLARLKAEIDPAKGDLANAAKMLRSRSPTADQIAEARTAAIVVQKLVDKFDAVASRSPPGAQYLGEVKKTLTEVEVDLQRRNVEPTRTAVASALKSISARQVEEATFAEAEAVLKNALSVLSQGERLEKLDRTYASYGAELKRKFQEGLATIAARRIEIQVSLQRTALETAQNDVSRTLKSLQQKSPSDDQFAEAKTALVVLEKTIETATAKDPTITKLAEQLKVVASGGRTTIEARRLEIDLERQKKRVEDGRAEIATVLGKIAGSHVPEDKLKAVDDAIGRVKTSLAEGDALTKRDKSYDAYDREVKKRLEEAAAKLATRRDELAVEAQREKVEPRLKELLRSITAIDGIGKRAQLIDAAEKAMQETEGALASGTSLEVRVPAYASWVKETKKGIESARARIAKKRLELAVSDGRGDIDTQLSNAKASLEIAKQPESAEKELSLAADAIKAVSQAIEQRSSLEKDDKGYATAAGKARTELARLQQELELAQKARALRKATGEALATAVSADTAASKSSDIRKQKEGYEKAVSELKNCQRNGERLLDDTPEIANVPVLALGQRSDPKGVIKLCAERQALVEEQLKKVVGLVTFEDGPKRFYQAGKAKAASSPKDALAQFDECVSSGKVLEYKSPELKDRKFDVAGAKMTLSELVAACVSESKRLQKK